MRRVGDEQLLVVHVGGETGQPEVTYPKLCTVPLFRIGLARDWKLCKKRPRLRPLVDCARKLEPVDVRVILGRDIGVSLQNSYFTGVVEQAVVGVQVQWVRP